MAMTYARTCSLIRETCRLGPARPFAVKGKVDNKGKLMSTLTPVHCSRAAPKSVSGSSMQWMTPSSTLIRAMSTHIPQTMQAWQALQYGGPEQLQLTHDADVPVIRSPDDVLVRIEAASVNPIDERLLDGYGKTTLNAIRRVQKRGDTFNEFPLVLGRDFAGEVIAVGKGVYTSSLKPGDKVWGVCSPFTTGGSHAEYALTSAQMVARQPKSLTAVEAASFPYCAMTMWSAVCIAGGLSQRNASGKRVLILGGSGGIGLLTTQLLKAWQAEVTVVCSQSAEDLVLSLGADLVLDYGQERFQEDLQQVKGFDLIIDLVPGKTYEWTTKLLKKGCGAKYVTLNYPMLANNDQYGLPLGIAKSLLDLSVKAVPSLPDGQFYRWAVFSPSLKALKTLENLIHKDKMQPVVQDIIPFENTPQAYERLKHGHNHGKIVIDLQSSSDSHGEHAGN